MHISDGKSNLFCRTACAWIYHWTGEGGELSVFPIPAQPAHGYEYLDPPTEGARLRLKADNFGNPEKWGIYREAERGTRRGVCSPESRADMHRDFARSRTGIDAYLVSYKLITDKNREIWVECIGKKIPFGNSPAILVSIAGYHRSQTHWRRTDALQNFSWPASDEVFGIDSKAYLLRRTGRPAGTTGYPGKNSKVWRSPGWTRILNTKSGRNL